MEILSHRYLLAGKNSKNENTLSQLKDSLKFFNFFETDIRRLASGEFYISHNEQTVLTPENDAVAHTALWKNKGAKIALNIKELGYEQQLVEFLRKQQVVNNLFLFDFDIEFLGAELQSYINNIHSLEPGLRCAVRVSDHNETIERALAISGSKIIWLDEFDSLWANNEDIQKLKDAGKTVYCIAPDLHNFSQGQMEKRFHDFIAWEVDGICTDYPLQLKQILAQ